MTNNWYDWISLRVEHRATSLSTGPWQNNISQKAREKAWNHKKELGSVVFNKTCMNNESILYNTFFWGQG